MYLWHCVYSENDYVYVGQIPLSSPKIVFTRKETTKNRKVLRCWNDDSWTFALKLWTNKLLNQANENWSLTCANSQVLVVFLYTKGMKHKRIVVVHAVHSFCYWLLSPAFESVDLQTVYFLVYWLSLLAAEIL